MARYFGNRDVQNKLNTINIVQLRNLDMNFEQMILNETMCKFYTVVVIRPTALLSNLWAAGLYRKFPQLQVASQQATVI
jgi:histone acetyltransferase (RNA polymerase elongator complex component)